jgi:hypothetical protein
MSEDGKQCHENHVLILLVFFNIQYNAVITVNLVSSFRKTFYVICYDIKTKPACASFIVFHGNY